jgi:hypothetical protein
LREPRVAACTCPPSRQPISTPGNHTSQ